METARWIQRRVVAGLVLRRTRGRDWRPRFPAHNDFPFVAHGHALLRLPNPFIEIDSCASAALEVKCLVARGRRHIADIGAPQGVTWQAERLAVD